MRPKKLLFIHDALPAEGISGMIVFLRHFKRLQNWNIEILIPENAYNQEIVDSYPTNFKITIFPLRKRYWPPFRESLAWLVNIRLFLLRKFFGNIIKQQQPDVVISVLYHYYSVAASQITKDLSIPFLLFLHDRWDIKTPDPIAQKLRINSGKIALSNACSILSVTQELIDFYEPGELKNAHVVFPIPEGYKPVNETKKLNGIKFIYSGTIESHHISFFKSLIPVLERNNYTLTIVTNAEREVKEQLGENKHIFYRPSFEKNIGILEFIDHGKYAVIVNYGFDENDNKFVMNLELPMIAIGYEKSPFYRFLEKEKWPLLFNANTIHTLEETLKKLESEDLWNQASAASKSIFEKHFRPEIIQEQFEGYMSALIKLK
jgi:hypothetical protein